MTSILQLPEEVIPNILHHLPLLDRKSARRACRSFYKASLAPEVARDQLVSVVDSFDSGPAKDMMNSATPDFKIYHLRVISATIDAINPAVDQFFTRFGEKIEHLELFDCKLSETALQCILSRCPNLTSLRCLKCSSTDSTKEGISSEMPTTTLAVTANVAGSSTIASEAERAASTQGVSETSATKSVDESCLMLDSLRSVSITSTSDNRLLTSIFAVLNKCRRLNVTKLELKSCTFLMHWLVDDPQKKGKELRDTLVKFFSEHLNSISLSLDGSTFILRSVVEVPLQVKEVDFGYCGDDYSSFLTSISVDTLESLSIWLPSQADLTDTLSKFSCLCRLHVQLPKLISSQFLTAFVANLTTMRSLRHLSVDIANTSAVFNPEKYLAVGQLGTNGSLRTLRLVGFRCCSAIIMALLRCFPNVKCLCVADCSSFFAPTTEKPNSPFLSKLKELRLVSTECGARMLRPFPNLERLIIEFCSKPSDRRMLSNRIFPKLKTIKLLALDVQWLPTIATAAPNLEILTLVAIPITMRTFVDVTFPRVTHLSVIDSEWFHGRNSLSELLSETMRAVPNARAMAFCPTSDLRRQLDASSVLLGEKLRSLTLKGRWGRRTITAFSSSPGLQQLTLDPGVISEEYVATIRATNPHLCIMWSREKQLQDFNEQADSWDL